MEEANVTPEKKKRGRPAKPAVPLTDTPEFKEALAAGIAQGVRQALAMVQRSATEPGESDGSDASWMRTLAMEISQLNDQGTGRKRVAPEILRQRTEARDKMKRLIMQAHAEGRPATYQLKNKVVLDNRVIEPMWIDSSHITRPTEIDWPGVPNEVMVPLNDTAKEIHAAFMESIGSVVRIEGIVETLGVTPGGVVIRNGAVNTAAARRAPMMPADPVEMGVRVHHTDKPGRYVEKHILGTIQAPAQQSA